MIVVRLVQLHAAVTLSLATLYAAVTTRKAMPIGEYTHKSKALVRPFIDFKQGWEFIQEGIMKLKNILEGLPEPEFRSEEFMMLSLLVSIQFLCSLPSTIYSMCTQKPPHDYSRPLYDKYRESFEDYITSTVLPSLRENHDEFMLRELVKRWSNHKIMVRWLSRFFHYLDRYFIVDKSLPALNEVGLTCFRDLAECLKWEKDWVSHYLHYSSEPKLLEKVQHELLFVHSNQLLEEEHSRCFALLRDDKVEDLSRMYGLFSSVGLDPVSNIFKQHVTAEGTALVKQAEDAANNKKAEKKDVVGLREQVFVRKVIDLHDKYLAYVNNCFMSHSLFHKALKEAFGVFCNKGVAGSSSAELLASFCDNILKKGGSEKLSDVAIEETLEKVVKLLAYINDKDLFAEFYRKKLVRRLLFDKSANDDHERIILTKLKQQCGRQFTSKMEGTVTDLTLARENQANFEEYLNGSSTANPGIDLTVTVLTTGFWPSYKSFDLNLPAQMVKCVEVFREFYQTRIKHRKLTWIYSLGTCNINRKFEPKTMELIVTTYQLNLTDDDVVQLLHSLSCAKYKILEKEPNTKTISPTDYFEFNSKFTDKMKRIKIPLPPVNEKKKVIENVDKDRRYAIDASIVRIMKSRKVLGHHQLVMECAEQLGRMFKPDFKAVKKRIEDLITRDYLERHKDNPNTYSITHPEFYLCCIASNGVIFDLELGFLLICLRCLTNHRLNLVSYLNLKKERGMMPLLFFAHA
ncbi:hypothetical protein NE237_016166 [Protea cynaroides]|uniref:Cullin family profile domain-containing protein n=1 Tax=Protea cynaroides TaxID=273540 RepID=A0A9Q0QRS1_9MAGN|nr:hypothetical protein NE237_016166 [Protea cynaroides]